MVQIIPEIQRRPSMGQRLNQGIGRGLEVGSQLYQKHLQEQALQQENEASKRLGIDLSGIQDPKMRQEAISYALQGRREEENAARNFKNQSQLQKEKYGFESELESLKAGSKNQKQSAEEEEKNRVKGVGQQAFNGLANLLRKGNVGFGSDLISKLPFAKETPRDIGEFSSLTGGLESMLVDMVSRGTLSNTRFNYITENLLPKPNDRQETIRGKLIGLAEILDLDPSALIGRNSGNISKEENESQAVKTLDLESMEKIYDLSGGDMKKAERIAKKMGYKINE